MDRLCCLVYIPFPFTCQDDALEVACQLVGLSTLSIIRKEGACTGNLRVGAFFLYYGGYNQDIASDKSQQLLALMLIQN
jgi:hypothetical protein